MFNLNLTTRTGKTSFAKSLPGHYNYFDGEWALDATDETETVLEIECKQPGKQEGPLTRKPIT
ncbi:unnamed protein product, partial [Rotaria magnacalcarata]